MNDLSLPPPTNLVLVESGGSRSRELGRYPDVESAKAAAREAAGRPVDFSFDPERAGWLARSGERTLRILEPDAAARFLQMADTETAGGTTDLEMDRDPSRPEEA